MTLVDQRREHHDQQGQQLSRGELLRQWQERRRTVQQNPHPRSPKKVKVRVRRSHPTIGTTSAGDRLYQQGTVASRLKSKSSSKGHHQQQHTSGSGDGRRRKSEPYQTHKGNHYPRFRTKDNCFKNMIVTRDDDVLPPLSPLSCSCPSMILESPSSPLSQQDQYSYKDAELSRHHGIENGQSRSFEESIHSEKRMDLTNDNCEGHDVSHIVNNVTNRSSARHDYHDILGSEDWSDFSLPSGISVQRSPSQCNSFNSMQENQFDDNSNDERRVTNDRNDDLYEMQLQGSPQMSQVRLPSEKQLWVMNRRDKDPNKTNMEALDDGSDDMNVPSDRSLQSRETCHISPSHEQQIIRECDWKNQRSTGSRSSESNEWGYRGTMSEKNLNEGISTTKGFPRYDSDEDSFDWRKNQSPSTPMHQDPIVSHSKRRMSMSVSKENLLNGATPCSDASQPSPLDRTKENIEHDAADDDSFDWRQNLSPDTPPLQSSKVNHERRRQEYILISPRSPLDRFHDGSSPQSDPRSSSSLSDQEFDQDQELTARKNEPSQAANLGISANTGSNGATLYDMDHDDPSQDDPFSETLMQINGKTILQPLREEPETSLTLDSQYSERICTCRCCTLREAKSNQLKSLVTELRWRAQIAEAEKHKYQNQIYTIRRKFETRITPFRNVFDEISRLRQVNQRLLKENQETKATLECNVADLQKQMTESLTIVLERNAMLKEQLLDAEKKIEELRLGMDGITSS